MNLEQNKPCHWSTAGRTIVFLLAASSIACLMADFYRLCPMRAFTLAVFLPAVLALAGLAVFDRIRGDGSLWRGVMTGLLAGFLAAVAYDLFRLPFVFAREWGIESALPRMNLFKVFPRFGAMILGEPVEQPHYSLAAHGIGWIYHFSNGATFGVMYTALLGDCRARHWIWAVWMAVGLELGMLFTPYPAAFGIALTVQFVAVTAMAHAVFGVTLGLISRRIDAGWRRAQA
jgi:hypothetical protein